MADDQRDADPPSGGPSDSAVDRGPESAARSDGRSGAGRRQLRDRARDAGRTALYIPPALETTVGRLDADDFVVDATIADDRNVIRRTVRQVVLGGLIAANLLVVSVLFAVVGPLAAGVAALAFLPLGALLRWSFRKSAPAARTPVQFTRYEMRERRRE